MPKPVHRPELPPAMSPEDLEKFMASLPEPVTPAKPRKPGGYKPVPLVLTYEQRSSLFRLLDTCANFTLPPRGAKAEIGAGMMETLKGDASDLLRSLPCFAEIATRPR